MSSPYIGEIRMFGGNFAPRGFAFCDGQAQSVTQNAALYALIGTTYGGDGATTFALPDLRGRVPVGQGQGPNTSNRTMGEVGGAETVVLGLTQLPSHSHPPSALSADGTQMTPSNAVWAAGTTGFSSGTPATPMNSASGGASGGDQAHENMIPFTALTFIIALTGVMPSPN